MLQLGRMPDFLRLLYILWKTDPGRRNQLISNSMVAQNVVFKIIDLRLKLLFCFNPMQYTLFSTVGSDYAGGDDMMKELKNVTKVIIK